MDPPAMRMASMEKVGAESAEAPQLTPHNSSATAQQSQPLSDGVAHNLHPARLEEKLDYICSL
jgi:hypothetical protein